MIGLALAFLLPAASHAASAKPSKDKPEAGVTASTTTVWLVETFIKTPTARLPPEAVPEFLQVKPATLPKKLRDPYEAKRLELLALKRVAEGRRKPPVRLAGQSPANSCDPPRRMDAAGIGLLSFAGFFEILEDEEEWLMKETNCTECELQTEFSLTLVEQEPAKKGQKPRRRYFLQKGDPIVTVLGHKKTGTKMGGTNFFGTGGGPKCR